MKDGDVIAATREERFTRKKHDRRFPTAAIQYCLDHAKIKLSDVGVVTFYDKPWISRFRAPVMAGSSSSLQSTSSCTPKCLIQT